MFPVEFRPIRGCLNTSPNGSDHGPQRPPHGGSRIRRPWVRWKGREASRIYQNDVKSSIRNIVDDPQRGLGTAALRALGRAMSALARPLMSGSR